MKIINIEQIENGGKTSIVEQNNESDQKEIYNSNYSNALNILGDLRRFVFNKGNINSKKIHADKIVLKRDDGLQINLINFNHYVLDKEIEEKIKKSYDSFLDNIQNKGYDYLYLTASNKRINFNYLNTAPNSKYESSVIIELELDENNNLTDLSKKMLNEFLFRELSNWNNIFLYNDTSNIFKICCDTRVIAVNSALKKYVKPEAEKMQQIYFEILNRLNEREENYGKNNNGKNG